MGPMTKQIMSKNLVLFFTVFFPNQKTNSSTKIVPSIKGYFKKNALLHDMSIGYEDMKVKGCVDRGSTLEVVNRFFCLVYSLVVFSIKPLEASTSFLNNA